jgi:uncharacterized membrane protein
MTVSTTIPIKRISSIDILRGMVMVVMALDHTRDYFTDFKFDPTDLQHASTIMFFTRWITHFCAPVFIFLSGTSAFLSMSKGLTKQQKSLQLFIRGLWLIVLEVTIVRLGWAFDFDYSFVFLQVIWAIGVSMVVLSLLIFLPRQLILFIGLAMIFGHDVLDNLQPQGSTGILWQFLHVQSRVAWGSNKTIWIIYPLIPWVGVMASGYCFGALFKKEEGARNKSLYLIGIGAIVLFIVLRFTNAYGDPSPWKPQPTWWRTVLSFINCSKYPPSLLYLLMTLGPAIAVLPLLEKMSGVAGRIFTVYGRVPLFYYILHIYLIHAMAVTFSYFFRGNATVGIFDHPGYSLPLVYAYWLAAVAILYLPCRWFMEVKMNHRKWWLSYL